MFIEQRIDDHLRRCHSHCYYYDDHISPAPRQLYISADQRSQCSTYQLDH
jgi:hypothetical protein